VSVVDGHGGGTRLWLDVRADFTLGPGHFVVISQYFKEEPMENQTNSVEVLLQLP